MRWREKEDGREGSKVKTTGQIISVFQRGKGFPFASWKDRNRKHLERRGRSAGDVEKCEANVEITALVETALKRLSARKMTNARFPARGVLLRITP